jgi:hypothetical protein
MRNKTIQKFASKGKLRDFLNSSKLCKFAKAPTTRFLPTVQKIHFRSADLCLYWDDSHPGRHNRPSLRDEDSIQLSFSSFHSFFYNKFFLKQFFTCRKSTVYLRSKCVQWGWACCTDGPRPCWLRRKVVSWPLLVGVSGSACSQTGLSAQAMQSRVQSSRTERFSGVGNFSRHG